MPTILTDPIVKSQATVATLDSWSLAVVRYGDEAAINLSDTKFHALLNLRDESGNIIETRKLTRHASQLPADLRTAIRTLHNEVLAQLRAAALLPAGTDNPDLP